VRRRALMAITAMGKAAMPARDKLGKLLKSVEWSEGRWYPFKRDLLSGLDVKL
jgi:hypothetical protein